MRLRYRQSSVSYLATCGVGLFDLARRPDVLGIDAAGLLARWQRWLVASFRRERAQNRPETGDFGRLRLTQVD